MPAVPGCTAILLICRVDHVVDAQDQLFGLAIVMRATRERVTPIPVTALVTGPGLAPLVLAAGQSGRADPFSCPGGRRWRVLHLPIRIGVRRARQD